MEAESVEDLQSERGGSRNTISLFLVPDAAHAYVVNTDPPPSSQKRGRSVQLMRHDTHDEALPIIEWDASIVGQRAFVLVDEHKWMEAIIAAHGPNGHKLVLVDGRSVQRTLPDHRVALQIEAALDTTDHAAGAEGEVAEEHIPTCPEGHTLSPSDTTEGSVYCDGCGSEINADVPKAFVCHTCDYDLCHPCAVWAAKRNLPYLSSLSLTGHRHVRPTAQMGAPGAESYEAVFNVEGREKSLGLCPTVAEAAELYRDFVAEYMPCSALQFCDDDDDQPGGQVSGTMRSKASGGRGASSDAKKSAAGPVGAAGGAPKVKGLRQSRCGKCPGCLLEDCGVCKMCLDKPKFGGPGVKKQPCVKRTCDNMSYDLAAVQRQEAAIEAAQPIKYDAALVGRRLRILNESGEWLDGILTSFNAPKRGRVRYGVRLLASEEVMDISLPDENARLLPKRLTEHDPSPPLTRDEEKRAHRAQAALADAAARDEIERDSLLLHTSMNIDTGYRCVYAVQLRCGEWAYEVKTDLNGKKIGLGRYTSKLQAAVVFARHVESTRTGSGGSGNAFGNMLVKTPLPDSMEGGAVNTVEKILDVRDIEVDEDDEDDAFCAVCARDMVHDGNEILLCDGPGCNKGYHQLCLSPPLKVVPEGDWLCPTCVANDGKPVAASGAAAQVMPLPAPQPACQACNGRHVRHTCGGFGAPPAMDPYKTAATTQRRHTKHTLAALAAGLPYEAGIMRKTKQSLAAAVHEPPNQKEAEEEAVDSCTQEEAADTLGEWVPYDSWQSYFATPQSATTMPSPSVEGEGAEGAPQAMVPGPRKRVVRQYLVKLRAHSYARSEWLTEKQIEADGKLSRNCLHRFLRSREVCTRGDRTRARLRLSHPLCRSPLVTRLPFLLQLGLALCFHRDRVRRSIRHTRSTSRYIA